MRALRSSSTAPAKAWTRHGCRLPPDGARAARSRISRTVASGTGVGRNARQLNRDATASRTSMRGSLSQSAALCRDYLPRESDGDARVGGSTPDYARRVGRVERERNPGAASPHLNVPPRVSRSLNPGYEDYFVSVIAVYGPCGTISMLCTLEINLVSGFDSALRTTSPNSGSSARAARRLSRSAFEG